MAILFVVFIASIVLIVFSAVKSTDVYKDALVRAKAHPCSHRSPWFAYYSGIPCLREHKR